MKGDSPRIRDDSAFAALSRNWFQSYRWRGTHPQTLAYRVRGIYRQLRANARLLYNNLRFARQSISGEHELKRVLRARLDRTETRYKFLLFSPINNWELDLKRAFESFGVVEFFEIPSVPFFQSKQEWCEFHRTVNQEAVRFFESRWDGSQVNIVFCHGSDFNLSPHAVNCFKRHNTVVINFNWDDILWFHGRVRGQPIGVRSIAPHFDLNLSFSPRAMGHYASVGASAAFWESKAEDPLPYFEDAPTINRALFVGSRYGARADLVSRIRSAQVPIDVFGAGWGTRNLSHDELAGHYRDYSVTVGLGTIADTPSLYCIKGRDFEVPLAGGLYLTSDHPELRRCYEIGKEILTYKSFSDCVQQLQHILKNPNLYTPVRLAGYKKATSRHRWRCRVKYLLNLIID